MSKRGKLSKVEKDFILKHPKMSVDKIAKELDRTISIIEKERMTQDVPPPKPKKKEKSRVRKLMVDQTAGKNKGVTMMTKEASEVIEETKSATVVVTSHTKDSIFKPLG